MSDIVFTDADLARLEELLTPLSQSGSTMRPDEVQGYFTALASGPDTIEAGSWLDEVLGDAPEFEDATTEAELGALLQKLYDATVAALVAGEVPDLILYEAEDAEEADFWPWCNAYLYALDNVDTDWFEAADDEGFEDLLLPIMALGGMFEDEEEGKELITFTDAELDNFKDELPDAIQAVYAYWQAKQQAPSTVRREGDKVGRNDPCPCGSGKKYKACHGKN